METILIVVLLIASTVVFYWVIRRVGMDKTISTDKIYQQKGIKIEYQSGSIQIKKYVYPVSKVTAIHRVIESKGLRRKYYIKLEVDDMVKPVHKLQVSGPYVNAEEFTRRLCLALRKAGGPELK